MANGTAEPAAEADDAMKVDEEDEPKPEAVAAEVAEVAAEETAAAEATA